MRTAKRGVCAPLWLVALITTPMLLSYRAWSDDPRAGVQAKGKIKHVVIIVQENRTFDNIFGGDPGTSGKPNFNPCPARPFPFPNADASYDPNVPTLACGQFKEPTSINASHDVWQCLHDSNPPFSSQMWNNLVKSTTNCGPGKDFSFYTQPFYYLANDLRRTYWDIAQKYVLGDHFFAMTSTSSFPGHQYIVADQSVDTSKDIVADQPTGNGCKDGKDTQVTVPALGSDGYINKVPRGRGGECYPNLTLADLMEKKPVSWTHYISVRPDSTGKFVPSGVFDGFINIERWWKQTDQWPTSLAQLRADILRGKLASVIWVKPPCIPLSDHPAGASTNDSANWVGSVINWIGSSRGLWNETAIFVLWDDWGGFYDHVVPPPTRPYDRLGPGLRTPFLVISPYGVNGTVVHTQADYASVLKFVEDLFDLGYLTETDKTASDLTGFFDFSKQRPFVPVWVNKPFNPDMCKPVTVSPSEIDR